MGFCWQLLNRMRDSADDDSTGNDRNEPFGNTVL